MNLTRKAAFVTPLFLALALGAQQPPSGLIFSSVSAGAAHTCALTREGVAYCWGGNFAGQLGSDSATEQCQEERRLNPCSTEPRRVKGGLQFAGIGSGLQVTCGLAGSGAAYCWGYRSFGPSGDTAAATWTTPVMISDTPAFVSLAVGNAVLCGVTAFGAAYCAGRKSQGLLGAGGPLQEFGGNEARPVPVSGGLAFSTIGIGENGFACGVTRDGGAYCWGTDAGWGVLGRYGARSSSPLLIADAPRFSSLTVGGYHVCGLTADGAAFCWGGGNHGQLGSGKAENSARPVHVDASLPFRSISAGGEHTCALTPDGAAYCWGSNASGQLGNPDTHDSCIHHLDQIVCSRRPHLVAGDLRFTVLSSGASHTCGVATDGAVYCWGSNDDGQLGVSQSRKQCGFGRNAQPCSLTPMRVSEPR